MTRIPPTEEIVDRYAESAVPSAVRLKRYWMGQGFPEEEATNKAVNQALGMMMASVDPRKALELLTEIEDMSGILKREITPDCARCPFMPSLNLFRTDDVREDAGGELCILHSTINNPQGMAIYHNAGGLVGSLEDTLVGCKELPNVMTLIHMFAWHSLRDLKASAFLAFSGRYRQALMTLRSALEIIFTGIYFQKLEDEGEKKKLEREWQRWWEGKRTKSDSFTEGKKASVEKGLLDRKAKEVAGRLYGELSKAVHGLIRDEFEEIFVKEKKPARPASAFFDPEFLEEWFENFFRIVAIMQDIIVSLPLKQSQKGRQGLNVLGNITKALEDGKRYALGFVPCPKLREPLTSKDKPIAKS